MTAFNRIHRALALAAVGLSAATVGHGQTWDLDACTGGTKAASGYTGCGTGTSAHGTVNITAYSSTGAANNFTTASTSINNGGTYLGVWSGDEGQIGTSATQVASRASPHHAIDNFTAYGSAYELVHLQFSKAVDLGTLVAQWANSTGTGDADFQVFRWNYNATTATPSITSFNPNAMPTTVSSLTSNAVNGWQLVHAGDFDSTPDGVAGGTGSLTQVVNDTGYFSSHWLITTAFGGSNDAFKLGSLTANAVCSTSVTSTGTCAPGTGGRPLPEPTTLAMVLLAGVGVTAARRRRRA